MDTNLAAKPDLDRTLHATEGKLFGGLSPQSVGLAFADRALQSANQPARRAALARQATSNLVALATQAIGLAVAQVSPESDDRRFRYPRWQGGPFALAQQAFGSRPGVRSTSSCC